MDKNEKKEEEKDEGNLIDQFTKGVLPCATPSIRKEELDITEEELAGYIEYHAALNPFESLTSTVRLY